MIGQHSEHKLSAEQIAASAISWTSAAEMRALIPLLAQITKEIFEMTGGEGAGRAAPSFAASPDGPPPSVLGHVTIVSIEASPEPPLVILGNRGYETKIGAQS